MWVDRQVRKLPVYLINLIFHLHTENLMTDELPSKTETGDGFSIGKGQAEYKPEDLQHLSDLEHVRERPSMYIGDTTSRGLHHLVFEVVDNSIDEAMAGYATTVRVQINNDGSVTVEDDGRGIPVGRHDQLS